MTKLELNRAQNARRAKALTRAQIATMRKHFTGIGATARSLYFVRRTSMAALGWFAKFIFIGSWAAVAGLVVGPEHADHLGQMHAWMRSTPLDVVLARSHAAIVSMASIFASASVVLAITQELRNVATHSADQPS